MTHEKEIEKLTTAMKVTESTRMYERYLAVRLHLNPDDPSADSNAELIERYGSGLKVLGRFPSLAEKINTETLIHTVLTMVQLSSKGQARPIWLSSTTGFLKDKVIGFATLYFFTHS
ncbi:hypothetical protein [Paenibacillus pedocola]|uniref:hypothetical protein n=1 Tax=Paenibacillus pedocola TaxID=3242193 RepID=UPI0028780947|nr:hypothetical protein [Paenibacillus typhae]